MRNVDPVELERLRAGAKVVSSPTLSIGTRIVEQLVDELCAQRGVTVAARLLLAELDSHPIDNLSADIAEAMDLLSAKLAVIDEEGE